MRNNDFIKFSAHHLNIFLMNFYVFFSLCYNEYKKKSKTTLLPLVNSGAK
jgi:hypothetical protein